MGAQSERGSILPLIGGAAMLMLVVVFGVSASTSLLIERARLFALADGAAVVAAESFNPGSITRQGSAVVAPMTSSEVRAHSVAFLAAVGEGALTGVVLERALSIDGRVVEVTLSSLWKPPLVSEFFPTSMRISVTARAQVFIR
jgi:hypothetical protein